MNVITKSGIVNRCFNPARETIAKALENAKRGDIEIHDLKFWASAGHNSLGHYRSTLVDRSTRILELLWHFNIEYSEGNDAPRGGQAGYFIRIPTTQRRKLRKMLNHA